MKFYKVPPAGAYTAEDSEQPVVVPPTALTVVVATTWQVPVLNSLNIVKNAQLATCKPAMTSITQRRAEAKMKNSVQPAAVKQMEATPGGVPGTTDSSPLASGFQG